MMIPSTIFTIFADVMELIFATNNAHKLEEIRAILGNRVKVLSLNEIGCHEDIEETGTTLKENALIKAEFIHSRFGASCFADDTGLEVEALGGEPGVYSARYAGDPCTPSDNINKLLTKLEGVENRNACFRTVIALIMDGETHYFNGEVKGRITTERHGTGGFGYDSVFVPEGYNKTFAELDPSVKNTISHRARATQQFVEFLHDKLH